jgi:hypothetical protein
MRYNQNDVYGQIQKEYNTERIEFHQKALSCRIPLVIIPALQIIGSLVQSIMFPSQNSNLIAGCVGIVLGMIAMIGPITMKKPFILFDVVYYLLAFLLLLAGIIFLLADQVYRELLNMSVIIPLTGFGLMLYALAFYCARRLQWLSSNFKKTERELGKAMEQSDP